MLLIVFDETSKKFRVFNNVGDSSDLPKYLKIVQPTWNVESWKEFDEIDGLIDEFHETGMNTDEELLQYCVQLDQKKYQDGEELMNWGCYEDYPMRVLLLDLDVSNHDLLFLQLFGYHGYANNRIEIEKTSFEKHYCYLSQKLNSYLAEKVIFYLQKSLQSKLLYEVFSNLEPEDDYEGFKCNNQIPDEVEFSYIEWKPEYNMTECCESCSRYLDFLTVSDFEKLDEVR